MHRYRSSPSALAVGAGAVVVAFAVAATIAFSGSFVLATAAGVAILLIGMVMALRRPGPTSPSRRGFLATIGLAGIGVVAGGSLTGRTIDRLTRPSPRPLLDGMASSIGSEGMLYLRRGVYPGRSGELQLVLAPFNTSNYSHESMTLREDDPRSSHAMLWGYTERVPIVVYPPGLISGPRDFTERATLADVAPTTARLMGFDFEGPDGEVLPGIEKPARPPKVVVTVVIDGGGWNVLRRWPGAWPNLRDLMRQGLVYRNATMGSFPSVTASAHATIGTGAFPRTHGISGHNMRYRGEIGKAWGVEGHADPSYLLSPTLADAWNEETKDRAWVGEIGYQVWHIGMIGRGGHRPLGRPVVAMYWDEDFTDHWQPQNPDLYRMPDGVPDRGELSKKLRRYFGEKRGADIDRQGGKKVCCSPPIIEYQGDVIETAFATEPIGRRGVTDLLYINFKAPDYTGHVYNMLSMQERTSLIAVDREIGRIRRILESQLPGEFVLIVTADHGQCPLVDQAGGVRLDPIQLEQHINTDLGGSVFPLVEEVFPSEVFLSHRGLWDANLTVEEVAARLRRYRYGENIGPYVPEGVVIPKRRHRREFSGVFPAAYVAGLTGRDIARFGPGMHPHADPGIPSLYGIS